MAKIPLFERSTPMSTQVGSAPASVGAATATANATAQLGGAVSNIAAMGQDYVDKRNDLKEKADLSDYEVNRRQFETNLVQRKTKASKAGVHYSKMYDEVVAPAMEEFEAEFGNRGYSKRSLGAVQERWGIDAQGIAGKEVRDREKMEITDYVSRIQSEAEILLSNPETEGQGKAMFADLGGIVGEGAARELYSGARYKAYNSEIAYLSESFKTGQLEPSQYVDSMKSLRQKIIDSDTDIGHKKTLEANMTYSIANASASQSKAAQKMETALSKDVIAGKVTPEWKETAIAVYGKDATENIEKILFNSLTKVAATNKKVRKGMEMVAEMRNSPMSYTDVVKYASDSTGEYGEELRELAAIVAAEHIKDGAAMSYQKYVASASFSPFVTVSGKERKTTYTGWVADVHDDIIKASETTEDMSVIKSYQRKLIDFYYLNPKPTTEEITVFKKDLLGQHWSNEAKKISAPQIGGRTITRTGMKDGKKVVQYSDGTVEYAD